MRDPREESGGGAGEPAAPADDRAPGLPAFSGPGPWTVLYAVILGSAAVLLLNTFPIPAPVSLIVGYGWAWVIVNWEDRPR